MNEVLILAAAEDEYTASLRWYAERSNSAAKNFEEEFVKAIEAISVDPDRYPRCDDRHRFYLLKRYPFQVTTASHPMNDG